MFNPNWNGDGPRPLSRKKTVQLMVALTILAWATQTLFHQWGFGKTVNTDAANAEAPMTADVDPATQPAAEAQSDATEKFVPNSGPFAIGATLEFRGEATVVGGDVKLKQICRWSDSEATIFAPIADLVVLRVGAKSGFGSIGLADLKRTLHDAGVNIAAINIVGATTCTIQRSDAQIDEGDALKQWIAAKQGNAGLPDAVSEVATTVEVAPPAMQPTSKPVAMDKKTYRSLRDQLVDDLTVRLNVPAERLQMTFHPQDDRLLNLSEPHFRFQIEPVRARNLGEIAWNVTMVAEDNTLQRATIEATARAWQSQVVVARPLSFKQVITDSDVVDRKSLVDRLSDETLLDRSQIVGQQAARDLKPGAIFTARMVDAIQLVRAGQLVTVVYKQGSVELKSAARAMEAGSFGQAIRVKNETTQDVFQVVLTGPQTGSMTPAGVN